MVQFKTIVYFDVGTTGVFPKEDYGFLEKLKNSTSPSDYSSALDQFMGIRNVDLDYPRMTDIAMSAISFENNDRSAEEMFHVNVPVSRTTALATVSDPVVQLYFVVQLDIDPTVVRQSEAIHSELKKSQEKFANSPPHLVKPLDQVYFVDSYYGFNNVDNWIMDEVHKGVHLPWYWLRSTGAPIAFLKKAWNFLRDIHDEWHWDDDEKGEIFFICTNLLAVYSLDYLYQALFGEDRGQHFSDIDVKDLMQVCFAYGSHFLYYIEKSAAPLISPNF